MEEIKDNLKVDNKTQNIESDYSDIDPENTIDITNRETDTTLFQRSLVDECYSLAQKIYNKLL
jgi:hypothetical protein